MRNRQKCPECGAHVPLYYFEGRRRCIECHEAAKVSREPAEASPLATARLAVRLPRQLDPAGNAISTEVLIGRLRATLNANQMALLARWIFNGETHREM